MSEPLDENLQAFLEIRQPGIDYEEHTRDDFAISLGVDLVNYKKFPRVDDSVTYPKVRYDVRAEIGETSVELPDYSGPFKSDLRFSDFSNDALVRMISMSYEYYKLLIEAWAAELLLRKGAGATQDLQTSVWTNGILPHVERIQTEFSAFPDVDVMPELAGDPVIFSPFKPDPRYVECDKEQLVKLFLGSHEFLLLVIEAWAAEVVVRYSLDEMFAIQWALWSDKVLPEVRNVKGRWMNIDTNDVAAFMKDIQIDATSLPGKAFDLIFEMPEPDVGIMTFNKCCAPDQWEALGRPDILEKNCHSTCPASLIETAKMYNPNMKVDILAIPPRVDAGNVCCKWKLSMRTEDDPEYVPVELSTKPGDAALLDDMSHHGRALGLIVVVAMTIAGCSNAASNGSTTTAGGGPGTTFGGTDYTTNVPVDVPGVSATEIHVGSITSKTNPIGGDNVLLNDGINAYFDTVNAKGGVWGRKLKLTSERDDQTGDNLGQTQALLNLDNVYAAFEAVELFTGAKALAKAGIPTFGWNANPEWAGPTSFFPNIRPICFSTKCSAIGRALPWIIHEVGAHKVALLGYGVPQSADSVTSSANMITQFSKDIDARVVYSDNTLAFGQTDYSAQVAEMKQKGVDFLATSLDFNGDYAIAKEMRRQGILDKVTFFHANLYSRDVVKKNAATFENGIVLVGIQAAEHTPAPPALQQYLDYADAHGLKITEMTQQGWMAARQFVDALKAAGPHFTWANLISAWNQQTHFTNGGLVPPIDWTQDHPDPSTNLEHPSPYECQNFVKVHDGAFVGIYDAGGAKPWLCFNGTKPNEWETPVNLTFANGPVPVSALPK